LNFLERFSKNTRTLNFMKIRPVGAEFHADGHEANSRFFEILRTLLKTSTVLSYQILSVKWHHALVQCVQMYQQNGTTPFFSVCRCISKMAPRPCPVCADVSAKWHHALVQCVQMYQQNGTTPLFSVCRCTSKMTPRPCSGCADVSAKWHRALVQRVQMYKENGTTTLLSVCRCISKMAPRPFSVCADVSAKWHHAAVNYADVPVKRHNPVTTDHADVPRNPKGLI
jgi:hypothetical protein